MTLEEAIAHAERRAENNYALAGSYHTDEGVYMEEEARCRRCAEEHEQLAEWLKELKHLRNLVEYSKDFNCTIEQADRALRVKAK